MTASSPATGPAGPVDGEQPLVSVCIPTYNRAALLAGSLESALRSRYPRLEVLVSDNASSDRTPEVTAAFAARDARVRVIRQPRNLGPTGNFEALREQARGCYFLWLADDDRIPADYIERCVAELERDPCLSLVSGLGVYHYGDGQVLLRGNLLSLSARCARLRLLSYLWRVTDNSVFYGVYRRERVTDCALPNRFAGDWCWLIDVLATGPVKVLPELTLLRSREVSTSANFVRLAQVLGLPPWQGRHPDLAIVLTLAGHLALRSKVWRGVVPGLRWLDWPLVALVVSANRLRPRIRDWLKQRGWRSAARLKRRSS